MPIKRIYHLPESGRDSGITYAGDPDFRELERARCEELDPPELPWAPSPCFHMLNLALARAEIGGMLPLDCLGTVPGLL